MDSGIKKWACLNCPGGCGVQISLSLNPDRHPRWTINQDLWGRPTVSPSRHINKNSVDATSGLKKDASYGVNSRYVLEHRKKRAMHLTNTSFENISQAIEESC